MPTHDAMEKVVYRRTVYPIEGVCVQIRYTITGDLRGVLAISGDTNNAHGQIYECLSPDAVPKEPFTKNDILKLREYWERWHLNDTNAGTPKQEAAVRAWKAAGNKYDYKDACNYLKTIDLYEDDGYRYGSKWLFEEVPQEVIRWLFEMPGEGSTYYDIFPPEINEDDFLKILGATRGV